MDIIFLIVGFLLTIGITVAALLSSFRFMISMVAGIMWVALGLLLLDLDLIMPICCVGMGIYMLIRSFID